MPNIINYYEELKISKSLDVNEINQELSKLERTWRRRELVSPDKSAKIIALIIEAREVFRTDATRHNYDQLLQGEKPNQDSKAASDQLQMEKYKNDTLSFFYSKQYDLSLITINKALSLMTELNIEDSAILSLAANVYRHNGDVPMALDYINRAIIADTKDPMSYFIKAAILGDSGNVVQKRNNLKISIDIADKNYLPIKKEILGVYARSLYFEYPQDKIRAEQYAREASKLGETWGNAHDVLNAVKQAIETAERQRENEARQKAEQEQRERERQAQLEKKAQEEKRRQEEAKRQKAKEIEKNRKLDQAERMCHVAGIMYIAVFVVTTVLLCILAQKEIDRSLFAWFYVISSFATYTFYRYARALNGGNDNILHPVEDAASVFSVVCELCMLPASFGYALLGPKGSMELFEPIMILGIIIVAIDTIVCWQIGKKHRQSF